MLDIEVILFKKPFLLKDTFLQCPILLKREKKFLLLSDNIKDAVLLKKAHDKI